MALNPIVYLWFNRELRGDFLRLIGLKNEGKISFIQVSGSH